MNIIVYEDVRKGKTDDQHDWTCSRESFETGARQSDGDETVVVGVFLHSRERENKTMIHRLAGSLLAWST
jgi:hypothetical protein